MRKLIIPRGKNRLMVIGGLIVAVLIFTTIFGPGLAPYSPTDVSLSARLQSPTLGGEGRAPHLLGTDQLGRDILSRLLYAARVTVSISLISVLVAAVVGVTVGLLVGFFRGLVDNVLMRIVDVQLAFPAILLAITLVAVLGTGIPMLIFVFIVAGWVRYVRVIRAQVMVLKEMQFTEAARAIGASHLRILVRHLLPNLLPQIIILINLELGHIILMESSLSYLGLGVQPPMPTWGNMLNDGRVYLQTAWWDMTFPGLAIAITVLGVNLFGEGIRSVYDPLSRT